MKVRARVTGDLGGVWTEGNVRSGQQEDNHNCGPFVLMV